MRFQDMLGLALSARELLSNPVEEFEDDDYDAEYEDEDEDEDEFDDADDLEDED